MAPYTRSMQRRRQVPDWAQLQMEILDLILQRLLHPDCLNFGKVCRGWRSVFVDRRELSHPPPSILLRTTKVERFSIRHRVITHVVGTRSLHRGIFDGGQLLRLFSASLKSFDRIVGSRFGWLVIARPFTPYMTWCMFLLNPASNELIPLPTLALCSVRHVDLSSRPTNGTCVLVGRVRYKGNQISNLVQCRPGDKLWTIEFLQHQGLLQQCVDSVFHKGKFYLLRKNGDIVVCTFDPQSIIITQVLNNFCNINQLKFKRLVQSNGELLLVVHQTIKNQLLVFRNGEECGDRWVRVDSLGDQVLLIGVHGAESICTKDLMGLTYEPNYIYYWTLNQSVKYQSVKNQSVKKYSMIDGRMENIHIVEQPLEWIVTKGW